MNIDSIQNEIMVLLEKQALLFRLLSLAIKKFDTNNELIPDFVPLNKSLDVCINKIPISLDDYQNCLFEGKSIEQIENELIMITIKIRSLCDVLSEICENKGHDYIFWEKIGTFDFDSLEPDFEERYVYCCKCCGAIICLDEKKYSKMEEISEKLRILRKVKKIAIYQSHFKVVNELRR